MALRVLRNLIENSHKNQIGKRKRVLTKVPERIRIRNGEWQVSHKTGEDARLRIVKKGKGYLKNGFLLTCYHCSSPWSLRPSCRHLWKENLNPVNNLGEANGLGPFFKPYLLKAKVKGLILFCSEIQVVSLISFNRN